MKQTPNKAHNQGAPQTPNGQKVQKKQYETPQIVSESLFEVGAIQGCSFAPDTLCDFTGTSFNS